MFEFSLRTNRGRLAIAAVALVFAAAGLSGVARTRLAPPPPPPIAEPPGGITLPDRLVADAAAYDSYIRHASSISPAFTDPGSVTQALRVARAYRPDALVRGAIAYAAIAALQDKAFVDSIRSAGTTTENRRLMVGYILINPVYVYQFKDVDVAAGLARQAVGPAALNLLVAGKAVRKAAYEIQHQGWSKSEVIDLPGRLAATEAAGRSELDLDADDYARLKQSISTPTGVSQGADSMSQPYPNLVARALQIAAVAALGEARPEDYDRLASAAVDDSATACLAEAKLNFHQCLAVAKPNYEDVFCTGQHAMMDTGVCLAKLAATDVPIEPAPPAPVTIAKRAGHKHRGA